MTPATVIREARAQGVKLWAEAGALRYSGPQAAVAALLPAIREHKPALLQLLSRKPLVALAALAAELAQEHGMTPADAMAILDADDMAAIRAGDAGMIEAWRCACALTWPPPPKPEPDPPPEPETAIHCRDCRHWTPDPINPPHGLGRCKAGAWALAWPGASCSRAEAMKNSI
jgi:hypothetical protein